MDLKNMTRVETLVLDFTEDFPELPAEEATLNVTVDPAVLTPALEQTIDESGDSLVVLVDAIGALVKEWDLVFNGKPVPLTRESLMQVPAVALAMVLNGISTAMQNRTADEGKA